MHILLIYFKYMDILKSIVLVGSGRIRIDDSKPVTQLSSVNFSRISKSVVSPPSPKDFEDSEY
ncbi:hypothetical protein HDU92_004834 [Lobulomyces angularis]|nr:hypothetical protein HDU92_004834 [Lobulomyces angularis]